MPRYRVIYRYITEGVQWLDAKNKEEAARKSLENDMDNEEVKKHYIVSITDKELI